MFEILSLKNDFFFAGTCKVLDRGVMRLSKVDVKNVTPDSHCYDETELHQLTLAALFYALKHTDAQCRYEILVSDEIPGLLCAKIQSRDI